jgi:O-methyltransferase
LSVSRQGVEAMELSASRATTSEDLYLDLMKRCLTYSLWGETTQILDVSHFRSSFRRLAARMMLGWLARHNMRLVRQVALDPVLRAEGRDHPLLAHTMIGRMRLDNIQSCVQDTLANDVPGDLIETGVWRGGATILMRAVLKAYRVTSRKVWVADSFEGLPRPNPGKYPADSESVFYRMSHLAVSLEEVKSNFAKYGLLDEQVCFLKGWFKHTLPAAPIERLAVLRLDGDMYESTMDALTYLYPRLSVGGYLIVDDYGGLESCRQAVLDYRAANQISDEIMPIDWTGVYWRRS